ncbi:MAG: DUF5667 domain-containing protein [Streptosporangiales bacterium]
MTGWPSRGRRELARRLDADCAPGHRAGDPGVDRLVAVAVRLRSIPLRTDASPDFRDALRERLLTNARTNPAPRTAGARRSGWRHLLTDLRAQRGLALTTAVLTLVVAVAGLWAGADRALPGEPLYGLKLRAESVQLALTPSRQERGRDHLAYADRRLQEVSGLLQRYRGRGGQGVVGMPNASGPDRRATRLIDQTLVAMDQQTSAGAHTLQATYKDAGRTTSLQYLDDFSRVQRKELTGVLPELPAAAQPRARQSLDLVNRLGQKTSALLDRSPVSTAKRGEARHAASAKKATPMPSVSGARATDGHLPSTTAPTPRRTGTSPAPSTGSRDRSSPTSEPTRVVHSGACAVGLCDSDKPRPRTPHTPTTEPANPTTTKPSRPSKPSKPGVDVSVGPGGVGIDIDTCRLLKAC